MIVWGRQKEVFIAQGRKFALADIDADLQEALGSRARVMSCVIPGSTGAPEQLAVAYTSFRSEPATPEITTTIQTTLARGFGLRAGRIQPLGLDEMPRRWAFGSAITG